MPKPLLHRFVVDVLAEHDGTIVPAPRAQWRWEPARDEGDLPERLAALANATDRAIVTAASRFGPLRVRASALVVRESFVRESVSRDALGMLAELDAAREWYATGMRGAAPAHARAYVAVGSALGKLPPEIEAGMDRLLSGSPATSDPEPDAAVLLVTVARDFLGAWLVTPSAGQSAVVAGMERAERILRALAGVEPLPALARAGGAGRILIELLVSLPEFLRWLADTRDTTDRTLADRLHDVGTETLDEWRTTGAQLRALVETVALVSAIDTRPLSPAETRRLRSLARQVVQWRPPASLAAAEVAERVKPVLRARLENELDSAGIWPVRQGTTTGAYWRAIATLWERLTNEGLPRLCAAEGCNQPIGSRANRLYCDVHRAERQCRRVRAGRRRPELLRSEP